MITRRGLLVSGGAAALLGCGPDDEYAAAVRAVWNPAPPTTEGDLRPLVHYATLAANAHNAQAWRFAAHRTGVRITPDLSRRTPVVDPDDHHLFASLGCAAENLALAASAAGRAAAVDFVADGDGAVEVELGGRAAPDPLFDPILERQCTRSEYAGRPLAPGARRELEAAAALPGCRVVFVDGPERMEQALELIVAANARQVADPAFVRELGAWIRSSSAEAVATRDGLFNAATGNPTLPEWIGDAVFPLVFREGAERERIVRQVRSSAGIAVIVSERDDPRHWTQAGRAGQRFVLKATALGLRCAFLNQPVEVAEMRGEFARWLGVAPLRPDLVLRYGESPPLPKSLRRPVEAVLA